MITMDDSNVREVERSRAEGNQMGRMEEKLDNLVKRFDKFDTFIERFETLFVKKEEHDLRMKGVEKTVKGHSRNWRWLATTVFAAIITSVVGASVYTLLQ